MNGFIIFSGNSNPELAQKICNYLNVPMGKADVKTFSDGEIQIEINENVRSKEVFLLLQLPLRPLLQLLLPPLLLQPSG